MSETTPTVVFLVRHGLTPTTGRLLPGRAPGLGLADKGRDQAEAAAKRIAAVPRVNAVYASPLERARQTAAPIGRALRVTVRRERGLLELDVGAWTGLTLARARRRPEWRIVQRRPSGFRFPGGESFVEMQARMVETVRRLVERHPGARIVAVSHADPIKAVVMHALGAHLDHLHRIAIAPASITVIAYRPDGPTVLTVNSVAGELTTLGLP